MLRAQARMLQPLPAPQRKVFMEMLERLVREHEDGKPVSGA
jgi:hypothetical protein